MSVPLTAYYLWFEYFFSLSGKWKSSQGCESHCKHEEESVVPQAFREWENLFHASLSYCSFHAIPPSLLEIPPQAIGQSIFKKEGGKGSLHLWMLSCTGCWHRPITVACPAFPLSHLPSVPRYTPVYPTFPSGCFYRWRFLNIIAAHHTEITHLFEDSERGYLDPGGPWKILSR